MSSFLVKPASSIRGEIYLPADKSITHRAIIISAISKGETVIENFSLGKDCYYTIQTFRQLGIKIIKKKSTLIVYGKGIRGLKKSSRPIFVGDSGTTMRLILGILAGQKFSTTLTAGHSLSRRPMMRVIEPLRLMGAEIRAFSKKHRGGLDEHPPITVQGGDLKPITYRLPVASAQVKSSILFAGLYTRAVTTVIEPIRTRDHTEKMLGLFGADIKVKGQRIIIKGTSQLFSCHHIEIPGDISSASFCIVAAVVVTGSSLMIKSVSLNPRRTGLIGVLKRMGADININYKRSPPQSMADSSRVMAQNIKDYEPVGDLVVRSSALKGTTIKKEEIPSLIDEIPILMVCACCAKGRTIIESAQELRVKETDRISSMVEGLTKMGADIQIKSKNKQEDVIITGIKVLKGARVSSFGDHRTAMSLIIAGLKAQGSTLIDDISCIDKSFPDFLQTLDNIIN